MTHDKSIEKQNKSRAGKSPSRWVSSSILWALLFTGLIVVWALTGEIKGGARLKQDTATQETKQTQKEVAPFQVRTFEFAPQPYLAKLIIRGRTFSDTQVNVRAETAGTVIKLPVEKGDFVKKGTLLCQLEDGARAATALEAKALLAQAKADYEASKKLERRGHTAGLKVLENKALYDRAMAAFERAQLDLKRTKISAPFTGYVEKTPAKVGSLVSIGEACATLVSLDPLHVVGAVREGDVQKIKPGDKGAARLITGELAQGFVRFISATAEPETRTFRIELEIANPGGQLKSGITTDIEIPLPEQQALLLPPSILTLNDQGKIGVRAVTPQQKVEFLPVKILSEQQEGIWVEALPAGTSIITVGQDFVKPGQTVKPVPDTTFKNQPGS